MNAGITEKIFYHCARNYNMIIWIVPDDLETIIL